MKLFLWFMIVADLIVLLLFVMSVVEFKGSKIVKFALGPAFIFVQAANTLAVVKWMQVI